MRLLIFICCILTWTRLLSQENEILNLVFTDNSNFDITASFSNKKPAIYYVLNKTDKWNDIRFHLNENLSSGSIRKSLESDEHSPYNHSYIFKDPLLDKLFSNSEKQHLYKQAQLIKARQISDTFKAFRLIKSFNTAKFGFFFSVTDPVFTTDCRYAFIDIAIFKKEKETIDLSHAYFGKTLLIYKNLKKKGWTRLKKMDYLIL